VAYVRANSSSCVTTRSVRPSATRLRGNCAELGAAFLVECRRRFIHRENARVHSQGACDRDALGSPPDNSRGSAGAVFDAERLQ
jgi:hypothetical protein